jgi:hypothetical protein
MGTAGFVFLLIFGIGLISVLGDGGDDGPTTTPVEPRAAVPAAPTYPAAIDDWFTRWSTAQAASLQETCRGESGCDPSEYAPSARPGTSFGWDGAQSVNRIEDWARGPRYNATANGRRVLIYMENGAVTTVDMLGGDGSRTNLCRDGSC